MTITPELLAEIKAKAEEVEVCRKDLPEYGRSFVDAYNAHSSRMDPPTTLSLISALEDAWQSEEAKAAKIESLSAHETCACSYDRPHDVCLHHSPQLSTCRAALEEEQRERDALCAENDKFRARLEIDHCYDGNGMRRELTHEEGDALPDGIECRDATISGLEGRVAELRAENEKLRGALAPFSRFSQHAADGAEWAAEMGLQKIEDWFSPAQFIRARDALKETTHAE